MKRQLREKSKRAGHYDNETMEVHLYNPYSRKRTGGSETDFFDYTMDEEYQLMMGYRALRGDHLFKEMWEPHQTSAFLCTGLMWLYKALTGTYTGILLYLRVCTTLIQICISLYLYHVLKQLLERKYALLCTLIYFNMIPKIIQIPDFSNMQLWFFTLTVLFLTQYVLGRDREHADRAWMVFGAGVWMSMEVLAYPSCVILFPFFLLCLYRTSGTKKWRDMGLFAGACAVCALIWLCAVLRNVSLEELLRNVKLLLGFDLTHELSGATQGKLPGILSNLLGGCGFLLLTFFSASRSYSGYGKNIRRGNGDSVFRSLYALLCLPRSVFSFFCGP